MIKSTKIKYLMSNPQIVNLPKYFALVGLLYSTLMPLSVGALNIDSGYGKPALLAMAQTQSLMILNSDDVNEMANNFMVLFGTTIAGQTNPNSAGQNTQTSKFTISASIVADNDIDVVKEVRKNIIVTAYSSTPDQTDNSPFVTAMGSRVRDGIVATNFLPFGTKIRFPEIFGDKIFAVEDRMAKKNSHKVDVWMESRQAAIQFGVKRLTIEILE